MKKFLVLLILLAGVFFGLKKWSPQTLARVQFWKTKTAEAPPSPPALPPAEPAPLPTSENKTASTPKPAATSVDKTAQVVALMYHRVEPATNTTGALNIPPEQFEQQMQTIKDRGLAVISMQDFLAWRRGEKSIPPRSVLITIDDGYVSSFDTARPILKKFGYPWTCFVYTKFIGMGGKSISWEQLGQLRDEGVEIGCHSISHINLRDPRPKAGESNEQWLRDEIINSKQIIEQRLGIKCSTFAYPEGRYNSHVLELVKEAGYAAAFTAYGQRLTHSVPFDRIGRYAWNSRRPQDMAQALAFNGPIEAGAEQPDLSEPAAATSITQPLEGETITDDRPILKANLATLGNLDPASVGLRLSGIGIIPCKFDPTTSIIEARPGQPLAPGEYTVTVSAKAAGKRVETQWRFKFEPAAKPQ